MAEESKVEGKADDLDIDGKVARAVESLKTKHGTPDAALFFLINENHGLRDKNRELAARVPEGSVVLKDEDAKLLNQYRELGAPGEIRKAISEGSASKAEAAKLLKEKLHAEAAELHGFKPAVLKRLASDLDIEIVDETKDGTTTRVAKVKGLNDKGEPMLRPLTAYADAEWKDFLPALTGSPSQPTRPRGTPLPSRGNESPPRPGAGTEDAIYEEAMRLGQYQRM